MPVIWEIVGGADTGGVLVRASKTLGSNKAGRISTGARVQQLNLDNDRLEYIKLTGEGPPRGWISISLPDKVLAKRVEEVATESPKVDAPPIEEPKAPAAPAWAAQMMEATQIAETEEAEAEPAKEDEPTWIGVSRKMMQAFRDGTKVLPPPQGTIEWPKRLHGQHPRERLPPFKRLSMKDMEVQSVKNEPGHFFGLKFPHETAQLKSFGPKWYTEAFHTAGTLPDDNSVTKIVSVKQLPHSGFDAAGGAGHKAFITLEYAKPDKDLHQNLFAKMPWDFFESEIAKKYRMQISTYGDMDSMEVMTGMCVEHLLPFRIPKFYFGDISRETTNYVLITEQIPFGRRGKVVNGKIVEKIERKPYDVLPVCGKYQDYLLDDPPKIYYSIFRAMAHLAAWDFAGNYEYFLGRKDEFTLDGWLEYTKHKPVLKEKLKSVKERGCQAMMNQGIDFISNVAPGLFTKQGKDKKNLEKLQTEICKMAPHFQDIQTFMAADSRFVAAMHMNLQADNAYFWPDEHGDLDVGVFDWCGFSRSPYVMNFGGCLSGAEADMLDACEEGLMTLFCAELERYGGPHIETEELLLRYHLSLPSTTMDACQWVERDIYIETPKEEWKTIKSKFDDKFIDRWNTRCRTTTLINAFDYYPRRDFFKIFSKWKEGIGKPFISSFV